jgi:hypothetical protein
MAKIISCENPILMMFIILTFLIIGYYFTLANNNNRKKTEKSVEGFTISEDDKMFKSCPTSLVKEGSKYYLFNKNIPKKDGVNPYIMDSLDEYIEFIEYQRSKGIDCPVLYIEGNYNAQGTKEYRVQRAPGKSTNAKPKHPPLTKLLDASRESDVYNTNMFAGFDKDNMYIGEYTPLDKRFHAFEGEDTSPNAMDPNWGGAECSKKFLAPQLEQRKTELSTDFTPKFIYKENQYQVRQ